MLHFSLVVIELLSAFRFARGGAKSLRPQYQILTSVVNNPYEVCPRDNR